MSKYHYLFEKAFFFVPFILYYVSKYFEYTCFYNENSFLFFNYVKYLAFSILLIGIILKLFYSAEIKNKDFLVNFIIIAFIFYQNIKWNDRSLIIVLLFGYLFNTKFLTSYLKITLFIGCILFSITVLASIFNIIHTVERFSIKFDSIWIRSSLGFNYPGQLLMSFIPIVLTDLYLCKHKKNRVIKSFVWGAISLFLFCLCKTVMPLIIILFYFVLINSSFLKNALNVIANKISYICCIAFFILVYTRFKELELGFFIDSILNYRLTMATRAIYDYGITLFGTGFTNIENSYNYLVLDSDYSHILITNGVIYLLLCLFIFNKCISWANKNNNSELSLVLSVMAINSIVNNGMFNLIFNPFIIILFNSLMVRNKK